MSLIQNSYPESRFGGFSDHDGTVAFYTRIKSLLEPEMTVLDVGCGRGAALIDDPINYKKELRLMRGRCRKVIGIDIDPVGEDNPGLDEFRLLKSDKWPIEDESIDLIISDYVLEHISNPEIFFKEISRVLKRRGIFCARTSNKIGYVGIVARVIPNRGHSTVLKYAQKQRMEMDVFPTVYKVNTVWKIRRQMKKVGLDGIAYGYEAEPAYLDFSSFFYRIGKFIHAFTPGPLRTNIFVFARKP